MLFGEIGNPEPVPADQTACASNQLSAVHGGSAYKVFGNALADEVGNGTFLERWLLG